MSNQSKLYTDMARIDQYKKYATHINQYEMYTTHIDQYEICIRLILNNTRHVYNRYTHIQDMFYISYTHIRDMYTSNIGFVVFKTFIKPFFKHNVFTNHTLTMYLKYIMDPFKQYMICNCLHFNKIHFKSTMPSRTTLCSYI